MRDSILVFARVFDFKDPLMEEPYSTGQEERRLAYRRDVVVVSLLIADQAEREIRRLLNNFLPLRKKIHKREVFKL